VGYNLVVDIMGLSSFI